MNKPLFSDIIGKTILSIELPSLLESDGLLLELLDSLVFRTDNEGSYQLLVSQTPIFRKLSSDNEIELDGEYDENHLIIFDVVNNPLLFHTPFKIFSVAEFWIGYGGDRTFLFGVTFSGKNENNLLSILIGYDEIEIISYEELLTLSKEYKKNDIYYYK